MKLKYYLRGLGLGILVTTLILSAGAKPVRMTDEEVRARAKELGMTEESEVLLSQAKRLADGEESDGSPIHAKPNGAMEPVSGNEKGSKAMEPVSGNGKSEDTGKDKADAKTGGQEKPEEKEADPALKEKEDRTAGQASPTEPKEEEPEEEAKEEESQEDSVMILIRKGETSTSVAKTLEEEGLILDAAQFDSYLCLNGYDRKLVVGPHSIKRGTGIPDIAVIITTAN
ncbi:MAG: hypothetical protein K6F35_04635 [Lachnospiraceae bacterium]|nr:hypothetical protein [Lachnospiraceae bacterium]